jgi:hypothetical protein
VREAEIDDDELAGEVGGAARPAVVAGEAEIAAVALAGDIDTVERRRARGKEYERRG